VPRDITKVFRRRKAKNLTRKEANMSIIRNTCFGALASVVAIAAANVPAAAQQQSGQISEARRAAIERCVQQAHQEAIAQGPGSGEQQQRYLIYSNCMVAAGFQP
jgi:hypothetical protein